MKKILILFLAISSCSEQPAKRLDATTLDSLNKRAVDLLIDSNYDSARTILNTILDTCPENPDAIYTLAQLYLSQENHEKAFRFADSVSKIQPSYHWIHVLKGLAIEKLVDVDSAIFYYEKALSLGDRDTIEKYHKSVLITIVNKRPMTINELDLLDITNPEMINELVNYQGGGWYEVLGYSDDLCFLLDSIMYWSHMQKYLINNGVNYGTVEKADSGFLIFTKKIFEQPALELGLIPVKRASQ